jgi:hypothetical protein
MSKPQRHRDTEEGRDTNAKGKAQNRATEESRVHPNPLAIFLFSTLPILCVSVPLWLIEG